MLRSTAFSLVCLLGIVGWSGCGGGTTSVDATAGATDAAGGGSVNTDVNTPAQAVRDFLEAVRLGNDKQASTMLTQLAQQKTAEMEMVVAPPGSDTASFEVGEVESNDGEQARVGSTWTDLDHDGNRRTDEIFWILKNEESGWRIAGMTTKIFPDQDPVLLDFEDPQQMLEQQRLAEEEAIRRANQQNAQARKPEDPFQQPSNPQ